MIHVWAWDLHLCAVLIKVGKSLAPSNILGHTCSKVLYQKPQLKSMAHGVYQRISECEVPTQRQQRLSVAVEVQGREPHRVQAEGVGIAGCGGLSREDRDMVLSCSQNNTLLESLPIHRCRTPALVVMTARVNKQVHKQNKQGFQF